MIYQFTLAERLLLRQGRIPQPIFDTDTALGLARALAAAVKTGLTRQLTTRLQPAEALAAGAGLDQTVVPLVLDCLEPIGYIRKKKNQYALSRLGRKFLSETSPHNLIHYILFSEKIHHHGLSSLEEILRAGRTPKDNLREFSQEDWKLFTLAMQDIARWQVDEISRIVPTPTGASRLLDLGGSHGLYSIYQCKKNPALKAEIFDLDAVWPYLRDNISQYHMQDQVSLTRGDFMEHPWPTGYDLVFAFNIIHGLGEKDNAALFGKAFEALKDKGSLVIFDQFKGLRGRSPLGRAVAASIGLNLHIQTGGRTYRPEEVMAGLAQAGFSSVRLKKLRTPGLGLIIAGR